MIFICCAVVWSLVALGAARWIWKNIRPGLNVHLLFFVSCLYFVGIFGSYGFF